MPRAASGVVPNRWPTCLLFAIGGCATIPSGSEAVVSSPNGRVEVLGEGVHVTSPLARVEVYDLRAQERDENLIGSTSDGAPVEARTSLVTYSIAAGELEALEREIGRGYYAVVVRPIVRSTVRRVLAGYRADQLDTATILAAQQQITELAATRLRPFHIVLDVVDLRTLAVLMSADSYRPIVEIGVLEQELLAQPQRLEVARQHGAERLERARAIAGANDRVTPTLTALVLADDAIRASAALLSAPSTRVIVSDSKHPITMEIVP
jgi:regulator of protease activity HflC (stomatin/prohibitin superfamily)